MFIIGGFILIIVGATSGVGIAIFMGLFSFLCGIGEIYFYKSIYDNNNKKTNIQSKTLNQYETKEIDKSSLFEQPTKENLNIFSKIATRYNLHIELNFEIIELIYSYVENTCSKYELENFVNIDREKLYNLFIEYCHEEISKMKTIAQVQNRHFGLMGITLICCIIITDNAYNSLKNEESLWEDAKSAFVEDVNDDFKEDFLKIMDKCYINLSLNIFDELDNKTLEELDKPLDIFKLLSTSLLAFAKKHSFTFEEEIEEEINLILKNK